MSRRRKVKLQTTCIDSFMLSYHKYIYSIYSTETQKEEKQQQQQQQHAQE